MRLALIAVLLAAAACGGSSPAPTAPAPAASASAAPAAPAAHGDEKSDVAWKDMTKEQRGHYMAKVVMPKMKETFQAFDAKEFSNFSCRTCHGAGAMDKSFKMPNPELPVLPSTPEGFEKLGKAHPEMMKFMATKVEPQMAQLLGEEPFDPKAPNKPGTFGCHDCHTMAAK